MFSFRSFSTLLLLAPLGLMAQSTQFQPNSEEVHLLNRLETLSGQFSNHLFLDNPYVSRKDAFNFLTETKSNLQFSSISNVDNYNINRALSLSNEWSALKDPTTSSKHPVLNTFYKTPTDLFRVDKNGSFFSLNPVLGLESVIDKNAESYFNTSAGVELRGKVKERFGFQFFMTHNYEEPQAYVNSFIRQWDAIPGAGSFNKIGLNGHQYLKVRGSADLAVIKDHISLSAGYDNHFIGNGMRSVFLSDFSEGALFASLNTKIWKLNYRNIYVKLVPQHFAGTPNTTGNKYATIHHLSVNVRPWLNIGLFESVTFSRTGGYEIGYVNPIIFYRSMERSMGSPDKVAIGMDANVIAFKRINLYSQFLINEFTSKQFFSRNGYWANKWALQLGGKYYNGFGVNNLDLQLEMNLIRPYTYTHYDRVVGNPMSNYTHFNQALAHPLGAGFAELIGSIRYQPMPRLVIELKGMYYKQGIDTGGANLGNNIFLSYQNKPSRFGVGLINGPEGTCMMGSVNASYEIRPKLHVDLGGTLRRYSNVLSDIYSQKELFFNAGVRLNLQRRTRNF